MPTPPPAPARFSTTIGCLSTRPIASAIGRATVSATPPGGKGTIIVIGRFGYSCALSGKAARSSRNANKFARPFAHIVIGVSRDPKSPSVPIALDGIVCVTDQRSRECMRIERLQIVETFTHADKKHRQWPLNTLACQRNQYAALGSSVELGDDEPRNADGGVERTRLHQCVLPVGSIQHEDHLVRRAGLRFLDRTLDALEFVHQVQLRRQPA